MTLKLDDSKLPDATVLRAQREGAEYRAAQDQLSHIGRSVQEAHEQGHSAIKWRKLLPGVEDALKRKGYTVKYYYGDQREPVPSNEVTTISW